MRSARIKEEGACYHIIFRIIDRRMLLDDVQKEYFRRNMRAVEDFSGVEILTWAALDNHIHILVHVPPPQPVSDEELIRRLHLLYEKPVVQSLENHLRELRAEKQDTAAEEFKKRHTYRMYELSEFVKTLKQRFTQNYNAAHKRRGTLWEGRFKSIVVQGSEYALSAVAAYIDLNAVRAGLVDDPKDYRFCGYGEAVAGCRQARRGISAVMLSLEHGGRWAVCPIFFLPCRKSSSTGGDLSPNLCLVCPPVAKQPEIPSGRIIRLNPRLRLPVHRQEGSLIVCPLSLSHRVVILSMPFDSH